MHRSVAALAILVCGLCLGCGPGDRQEGPAARRDDIPDRPASPSGSGLPPASGAAHVVGQPASDRTSNRPRFESLGAEVGVDFEPYSDQVPGRFFLPEIMGSGLAWLDYDLDGRLDLYFANGAQLDPAAKPRRVDANQLFRQQAVGQFASVSAIAQGGDTGFGQGVAVGDFDADGFPDLFLANYGQNALWRNNGDGTFSEWTAASHLGQDRHWSSTAVWLDLNGDTWLDLVVVNYLDATLANHQICEANGQPRYCGPGSYAEVPDQAYLSQGDGTFRESAAELGLLGEDGRGLGIIAVDLDDDLLAEIYVANDMRPNFLFSRTPSSGASAATGRPDRRAAGRFVECAAQSGCARNDQGESEASMGLACGDLNGDQRPDLLVTHFLSEKNTLYANHGQLAFTDESRRAQLAASSYDLLGFGVVAADFDHDRDLDLLITNGHVFGHLQRPHEMPPQLLVNNGRGQFQESSASAGGYFQQAWLGRGAAGGDFDNDGRLDVAVTHVGKPVRILRNVTASSNSFIGFQLATDLRLPPVGGRVVVTTSQHAQVFPICAGGSYQASSDPRVLCGLGDHQGPVEVIVYWPSGRVDSYESLRAGRYWLLTEGRGFLPAPGGAQPSRSFHVGGGSED